MIRTAMILAAGRGERMRPLTDLTPKPLLDVAGKPLICWHLEKLVAIGVERIVINLAHLGEQIEEVLGNGSQFGVKICYSHEVGGALETAGGIVQALPLLGDSPFLVVNGDIWTDLDFSELVELRRGMLAKLVLVNNPPHNAKGDFSLAGDVLATSVSLPTYTYAGIGLYSPRFFDRCKQGKAALAPLIKSQLLQGVVSGVHFSGKWCDVGTPERLRQLNNELGVS